MQEQSGLSGISHDIWNAKYRCPDQDSTINDTWRRVATHLASAEHEIRQTYWSHQFYKALTGFKFIPAGRILAGAGTGRDVTLFNCFVNGTLPDDLVGLYQHLGEAAVTMKFGGGIGYDFSTVRPYGDLVKGVSARASGPLAFMNLWNGMSKTIMSAGSREGAMMATLRCDHPDIEAFIEAKRDPTKLRLFNLSVLVTDKFMKAVADDNVWQLYFEDHAYKSVSARELWNKILRATYDCADPGVIFIDRVNEKNNLRNVEIISCTNPCGEQPLPPYGACLLGSINLAAMVDCPFTSEAAIDFNKLATLVNIAVRMLDNTIDVSKYPLLHHEVEARRKRRIGLGITGLADALLMCGFKYGDADSLRVASIWMEIIRDEAYRSSVTLAKMKGAFPLYKDSGMLDLIPHSILGGYLDTAREHGFRNSLLISVAPTGTISLLAGNVSSGIEPIFSDQYTRKIRQPDGSMREENVVDYAVNLHCGMFGVDVPIHNLVTASELHWESHLSMVAALQPFVDSSISKTINLPESISFEEFKGVYDRAYELGLKGCTTYRPNPITGSILTSTAMSMTEAKPDPVQSPVIPKRGYRLDGSTYKLRWDPTDSTVYLTVNDRVNPDGSKRPFEVFIVSKNPTQYAWVSALTLMISAVFRRDDDAAFVADELSKVYDPSGGCWIAGKYIPSLPALIGSVIRDHSSYDTVTDQASSKVEGGYCDKCGQRAVKRVGGCDTCHACGHSKCG